MSNFNIIIIFCIAVGGLFLGLDGKGTDGGHLASSSCNGCHVAEKVDTNNASVLVAAQERLCGDCHAKAIKMSHPSGFTPNHALPTEFPLDWKGDLTCSSCHLIHDHKPGLLRSHSTGLDFCLQCHPKQFFEDMSDGGVSVAGTGHLDASEDIEGVELDSFSLQCMGCHGEQGDSKRVDVSARGLLRHTSSSMNHPIGVSYNQSATFGGYRALTQLPESIVLPNGKLSCVSCHYGYSKKHGGLVIANNYSNLCQTCHDL
ncbi:MAG: cytochrome c3 family protein [Magnetococcales bacterium]|nr:cytochrome c3 family protein [Magnetococcales bacterium]